MAAQLSDKAKELISRPVLATVATLNPDGSPQVTPVWVEADGDDLLVNTAMGRIKARNIEHDKRVAVSVIDPNDPYNVVVLKGTVAEVTTKGADEHIDHLAKKYLGLDEYPLRKPGEVRIKVRLRPDKVVMQS